MITLTDSAHADMICILLKVESSGADLHCVSGLRERSGFLTSVFQLYSSEKISRARKRPTLEERLHAEGI